MEQRRSLAPGMADAFSYRYCCHETRAFPQDPVLTSAETLATDVVKSMVNLLVRGSARQHTLSSGKFWLCLPQEGHCRPMWSGQCW